MIFGVGVDIVQISRVQDALERIGEPFAHRILAPVEIVEWNSGGQSAAFLAKRWAAKEAFFKAAKTGMRGALTWQGVWIDHDELGAPCFVFSSTVQDWLSERKITRCHLSLSDEKAYAVAFVTLEC
jgi:holo-[acyl-carrier protein] synthase